MQKAFQIVSVRDFASDGQRSTSVESVGFPAPQADFGAVSDIIKTSFSSSSQCSGLSSSLLFRIRAA
jgi:hypothetical protein